MDKKLLSYFKTFVYDRRKTIQNPWEWCGNVPNDQNFELYTFCERKEENYRCLSFYCVAFKEEATKAGEVASI